MRHTSRILPFLIVVFCLGAAKADFVDESEHLLIAGQPDKVLDLAKSLPVSQTTPSALLNWGLAAYQTGQKGLAVGLWRRAQVESLWFSPVRQALMKAEKDLPGTIKVSEVGLVGTLNKSGLSVLPIDLLALFSCLLMAWAGRLWLVHSAARKYALSNGQPLPKIQTRHLIVTTTAFLTVLLFGLKLDQHLTPRATVIRAAATLKSGPGDDFSIMSNVVEGSEMTIEDVDGDWVKLYFSDDRWGWLPKNQIYQHSGQRKF